MAEGRTKSGKPPCRRRKVEAPDALCATDPPACGAGRIGRGSVGAASSRDLVRAVTVLLSFRSSRPGHFSRACGRGKAPPPCSPRCFAATSQGLPRPQPRKWLRPPAVTPEEPSSAAPGTRLGAGGSCIMRARANTVHLGIDHAPGPDQSFKQAIRQSQKHSPLPLGEGERMKVRG